MNFAPRFGRNSGRATPLYGAFCVKLILSLATASLFAGSVFRRRRDVSRR
jgi:hypothetical protein